MSKKLVFLLIFCFCAISLSAQTATKSDELNSFFKPVKWRSIGPFRGGRSVASTGVVGDPKTYYMGTTGGGLWKTDDMGISWRNISDGFFKTGFGRRDRGCGKRSECRLCRDGRTCGSRRDDASRRRRL